MGDGSAPRLAAAATAPQRAAVRRHQGRGGWQAAVGARADGRASTQPACTSCHRVIDPIGLALDNFDVTGKWRIKDNGVPVDASGQLYDGTKIDGPAALRAALLNHKQAVLLSFTEKLMTYALGRRVESYDMPTVREIIREAGRNDYKMSSFIAGIVNSGAFRMSKASGKELTADR